MEKKEHRFIVAIAAMLVAVSAVALAHVIKDNQQMDDIAINIEDIPNITDVPDNPIHHPTYDEIENAILDDMARAFAIVESRENPSAWNKAEDAVGCLQIRPIMVREANNILGEEFFLLEDRWDREMSFFLFEVIQMHHNRELDIDQACDVWNPGCSQSYRNKIKKEYLKLQ